MTARTPGSYLLLMELSQPLEITVGKLGRFLFPDGWYVYAGSALGGVEARVNRHLRPSTVRRWHVDYLRAFAPIVETRLIPGSERLECLLAARLMYLPGATVPVPRFGSSDCRCRSHLIHFSARHSKPSKLVQQPRRHEEPEDAQRLLFGSPLMPLGVLGAFVVELPWLGRRSCYPGKGSQILE